MVRSAIPWNVCLLLVSEENSEIFWPSKILIDLALNKRWRCQRSSMKIDVNASWEGQVTNEDLFEVFHWERPNWTLNIFNPQEASKYKIHSNFLCIIFVWTRNTISHMFEPLGKKVYNKTVCCNAVHSPATEVFVLLVSIWLKFAFIHSRNLPSLIGASLSQLSTGRGEMGKGSWEKGAGWEQGGGWVFCELIYF